MFRERLGPVLALAERYPDATDVFIDGDAIRLSLGDERLAVRLSAEFPGLTPRAVEAAGAAAAAVFAGVEFGPSPPARPLLSVKIPPDLRVTFVRPPAADGWHVDDPVPARAGADARRLRAPGGDDARTRRARSAGCWCASAGRSSSRAGPATGKTTLLRALLRGGRRPASGW